MGTPLPPPLCLPFLCKHLDHLWYTLPASYQSTQASHSSYHWLLTPSLHLTSTRVILSEHNVRRYVRSQKGRLGCRWPRCRQEAKNDLKRAWCYEHQRPGG